MQDVRLVLSFGAVFGAAFGAAFCWFCCRGFLAVVTEKLKGNGQRAAGAMLLLLPNFPLADWPAGCDRKLHHGICYETIYGAVDRILLTVLVPTYSGTPHSWSTHLECNC